MASRAKIAAGSLAALGLAATGVAALSTRRWAKADDPTGGAPLAVPQGVPFTVTTGDGTTLWAIDCGTDEQGTVVLSHCWTGDHRVWGPVAQRLVDSGHRVVLYDQRGHGASTVGRDGLTIDALADDLRAVLEQIDAHDVVVAGHSMGGMATQAFAIRHPDVLHQRVRGIALVATSSGDLGVTPSRGRIANAVLASTRTTKLLGRPTLGPLLVRGSVGRHVALSHLRGVRDTFVATAPATRSGMFLAMSDMDLSPGLGGIDLPAVIVVGTRDTLTPLAHARRMADLLPNARIEIIEDAGHMLPFEQPDRVAQLIDELGAEQQPEAAVRATGTAVIPPVAPVA